MNTRVNCALLVLLAVGCGAAAPTENSVPPPPQEPAPTPQEPAAAKNQVQDIFTVPSQHDFQTTTGRLEAAIAAKGLKVMGKVDHAANATSVGISLAPTTLFVFGKPEVGTRLMLLGRTIALDLPLKMLVWQKDDGSVAVTYASPESLAARHQISGGNAIIGKMAGVLGTLAKEATE